MDDVTLIIDVSSQRMLTIFLALIMFSVALGLKIEHFIELKKRPRLVFAGIVGQIIALPLFTLLLTIILQPPPSVALGMIVVSSCPGGNVSNFLTSISRGDVALSVTLTAISSISAVLLTPISIVFWSGFNPEVSALIQSIGLDVKDFLVQTTFMLLIPLILGMVVAYKGKKVAKFLYQPMRFISFFILIGFIVVTFANNYANFLAYANIIVPTVILHNIMALLIGFSAGKLISAPMDSRRALTFEVGIQNSGLGLVILLGFFQNIGGATMITAFWGVWHIISGLILSGIFTKLDKK